jgi:hypothetical protein
MSIESAVLKGLPSLSAYSSGIGKMGYYDQFNFNTEGNSNPIISVNALGNSKSIAKESSQKRKSSSR